MKPIPTKPMTPLPTLRRMGVLLLALVAGCAISACGSAGSTATSGPGQHAGDGSPTGTGTTPLPVSAFPTPVIHRGTGLSAASSSSVKVPLVIALHGGGGATPALFEHATGLDQVANQHNFVVAYLGSPLPLWKNPSDITYIGNMIHQLESSENIDPNRVYVVGFSLGGYATFRSACELSSQVAGVAIVSSAMAPLARKPCPVARPVSELSIVGSNDLFPVHQTSYPISADATASMWRTLDGCSSSSSTSQVGPTTQTTWSNCNSGAEVGEYVVNGGTHRWPGSQGSVGADGQYDAAAAIWSFLSKHSASSAKISAAVSSLRVTRGRSRQVRLVLNPIAESSAVLLMMLSVRGRSVGGRNLASKRVTLHAGRRITITLNVPRRAKAGRDTLSLGFVDGYGQRQSIVRTVKIPALPSSHHAGKQSKRR
jgi:polyhydroxybutyrate depolymerase